MIIAKQCDVIHTATELGSGLAIPVPCLVFLGEDSNTIATGGAGQNNASTLAAAPSYRQPDQEMPLSVI